MRKKLNLLLVASRAAWWLLPWFVGIGSSVAAADAVTLTEDAVTYTLANGIVTAQVAKDSGDLVSLRYRGREMLATFLKDDGTPDLAKDPPGHNPNGVNRGMTDHQYAFWSHDAMGPRGSGEAIARVTIDPQSNGGERAEVAVKGVSRGRKMGTGPGVPGGDKATGQFAADIEIRYALGRGEAGVYTYCQFEHPADYPTTALGEARFCAKLADFFDWMSVAQSEHHFKHYPADLREGDKYIYTVVQSENPAFGWTSTTKNVGFWCLNASMEYMSGGPTKVEFQGHRDTNRIAAPCVLNYWRSSHYGGAAVDVAEGEQWTKVIGPFMLYVNAGADAQAMFDDAKARQKQAAAAWPFDWVAGVDYPRSDERATVRGQITLADRLAPPGATMANVRVGLTAPAWTSPMPPGPSGVARRIDWQQDAKHYQFWTRATDDGRFEIPHVRPGTYTLRAFADGVLGEFVRTDVTVEEGKPLDLGELTWKPVRHGKQVWDIGVPNRNGSEFFKGDAYWEPDISLEYAKLFPDDINFVLGKSDHRTDWFFQHVPHNEDPNAKAEPFYGVRTDGRATPRTVTFAMEGTPRGRATLRLAICGTGTNRLDVAVNGESVGAIEDLRGDGVIARHGIQGIWYEREFVFNAARLHEGENTLTLTVPAGRINNGLIYDYLRLELDEFTPMPARAELPTLFIAGDSTAANNGGDANAVGWGTQVGAFLDPAKVNVVNRARGGRSSRTFITEGLWSRLIADVKAGDTVLIQFGHNDGSPINDERRARGSLPGLGDETEAINNLMTKQHEVVRTFGSYLREMIADVRAKNAQPILLSLTGRNLWQDGRVERGSGQYGQWTRELAEAERVPFVDLTKLVADHYETLGEETVKAFFPRDHTHTSEAGAQLNARLVVSGLRGLRIEAINQWLSAAGRQLPVADPDTVFVAAQPPPKDNPAAFRRWLNLPEPADPALPSLFLVGDSTVRNGRGDGYNREFGWGDPFAASFDPAKINVVNRAVGGTGARTFRRIGYWNEVLAMLKPGDVVIMQFGHNDNGARGALKGIGDETEERDIPDSTEKETVHTFGWYLRQYIAETRAKGATPIVCSLVPRKSWTEGKITRTPDTHRDWARAAAESEGAAFIDLHELIAGRYDALGEAAVESLFADRATHTSWEGAKLNAECVLAGLRQLQVNPLAPYLR